MKDTVHLSVFPPHDPTPALEACPWTHLRVRVPGGGEGGGDLYVVEVEDGPHRFLGDVISAAGVPGLFHSCRALVAPTLFVVDMGGIGRGVPADRASTAAGRLCAR